MPGNKYKYIEDLKGVGLNLELFGFFYCKVKTNNDYFICSFRWKVLPNGEFGFFSESLKFKDHGYEITVLKGYNFNAVDNLRDL